MDVSRLARLGWAATTDLEAGIKATYAWFLEQGENDLRSR